MLDLGKFNCLFLESTMNQLKNSICIHFIAPISLMTILSVIGSILMCLGSCGTFYFSMMQYRIKLSDKILPTSRDEK